VKRQREGQRRLKKFAMKSYCRWVEVASRVEREPGRLGWREAVSEEMGKGSVWGVQCLGHLDFKELYVYIRTAMQRMTGKRKVEGEWVLIMIGFEGRKGLKVKTPQEKGREEQRTVEKVP